MNSLKKNQQINIVIDSNLFISSLFGGVIKQLISRILHCKEISIISCSKQILEIDIVLERPRLKELLSLRSIEALKAILKYRTKSVIIISDLDICRDKKDNYLISLAYDSNCNYLLTGDKDLLELNNLNFTKIITITDFISEYFDE